jgi:hypothetical protein
MAEFKDHQTSELELFRREILNKDGMIEVLQNNVKDLQEQLQNSYRRIEELKNETCNCGVCGAQYIRSSS